jgi:integrase
VVRTPKPWFWAERQSFYVTIRGTRHNLGPDEDEADRKFHELMAARPSSPAPVVQTGPSVAEILDQYLHWCEAHRKPRTYEWHHDHLQSFLTSLGSEATLPTSAVKPFHVIRWADAQTGWGACRRRGGIIAVQWAFNWAAKVGHIDRSPVGAIEKPTPKRREKLVSADHYATMLGAVRAPIRDLLTFAWETGARPQEVFHFEARHYSPDRVRLELPPAEAKGKKRWRVVYLTDMAKETVERLVKEHPDGKLFRNCEGLPWNKFSMSYVFGRMKKRLGGVKYALYDFRHTFCQRMLEAGVNHVTVAELMGHANAVMVATTYSHMNKAEDHLRAALRKAAEGAAA